MSNPVTNIIATTIGGLGTGAALGAASPWAATHPKASVAIGAFLGGSQALGGSVSHRVGQMKGQKDALDALDAAVEIRDRHRSTLAAAGHNSKIASLNPKLANAITADSANKTQKNLEAMGPLVKTVYRKIQK